VSVGVEDRSSRLLHVLIVSLQIGGILKVLEGNEFRLQSILTALHIACVSISQVLHNDRSSALTRIN
jgi:hypothetical protein